MITLNTLDVIRNAVTAYKERRLSAQGKTPQCSYRDNSNCPCVIGVSIPDQVAESWDSFDEDTSISHIYEEGEFITDNIDVLSELQSLHDQWARNSGDKFRNYETFFVEFLNEHLPVEERIPLNQIGDGGTKV